MSTNITNDVRLWDLSPKSALGRTNVQDLEAHMRSPSRNSQRQLYHYHFELSNLSHYRLVFSSSIFSFFVLTLTASVFRTFVHTVSELAIWWRYARQSPQNTGTLQKGAEENRQEGSGEFERSVFLDVWPKTSLPPRTSDHILTPICSKIR